MRPVAPSTVEAQHPQSAGLQDLQGSGGPRLTRGRGEPNPATMPDEAQLRRTQVNLGGLLEVLGKHLYSTPAVALRELVQNAHDSCIRRRLEAGNEFEPSITVRCDPARHSLIVEDTGAGLTHDEIERYLATVGSGYTRALRQSHADAGLIGQFGLGFLTAYVVSDRVDLLTTSYQAPNEGWHFSSHTGEQYTLRETEPGPIGTRVQLSLSPQFRELSEEAVTGQLLARFCALLRLPVYLGDTDEPINDAPVPWRLAADVPNVRRRRVETEFARRFERTFEPLVCFALNPTPSKENDPVDESAASDDPAPNGLVWIQDGATYATSDNRNVSVYVRGMLVSDDARDLMPPWAGFAGAVIESDTLKPTASREDLQKDGTFEAIASRVRETLIDGLSRIARQSPETWRTVLLRHNEALLGAALSDDRLFNLLRNDLKVPTSEGDLTLPIIAKRSQGKLHVSLATRGSPEETLFRALGVPVISGNRYGALPFAQAFATEGNLPLVQMGTEVGDRTLFPRADLSDERRRRLEALLLEPGQALVPCRFRPIDLPLLLIPDREVELKERLEADEADRRISTGALSLARMYTNKVDNTVRARLYLNLDSPVVDRLADGEGTAFDAGAQLLKAFAAVLASHRDTANDNDLSSALAAVTRSLETLLNLADGGR